jgi:hypothetical protein
MKNQLVCLVFASFVMHCGVALGDSVNAVSCSTPGAGLMTGTVSCSAAFYGYANATSTSSISLPSSVGQPLEIDAADSASAMLGGARGISSLSMAESTTDVALNLDTAGSVRNGYLALNFLQSAWTTPGFGSLSELLTIGGYSVSPDGQNLSVLIPIELGTAFGLNYLDSIVANGDAGSGVSSGAIGSTITLAAFEADGTTAVDLFDPPSSVVATPEPGAFGMVAAGLILGMGLVQKLRR